MPGAGVSGKKLGLLAMVGAKVTLTVPMVMEELQLLLGNLLHTLLGNSALVKQLPLSAPDLPRDCAIFTVLAIAFFALNWGFRLLVVQPLVKSCLTLKRAMLIKYVQSVMEVIIYSGFTIIGLAVVPTQDWVWPSAKWWIGFADGGHELMQPDLRCYYLMYIARYSQAIVSVLFETKRKDFLEMMVHHVVTVVVCCVSYVYGWNRIGVVVMLLVDPGDVPLHLAKLCKYTAAVTKRHFWHVLADRLFEVFAVVFLVTRIFMYSYVCWSAHIEATRYFAKGIPEWSCVVLLYTLLILQLYWFNLIIKVAIKFIRGEIREDPRSDDEDASAAPAHSHQD